MMDESRFHEAARDALHRAVCDAVAPSARVTAVASYRPGYRTYPARLVLEMATGAQTACVLKVSARHDRVAHEARVLRALTELAFPVPAVLAGPLTIAHEDASVTALVLSEASGRPLPWLGLTDLASADLTCRLLHEGIAALHGLTARIGAHPVAATLPAVTLEAELQAIIARGGPCFALPWFTDAVDLLGVALPTAATPLAFSNGDYNPLNFLHSGRTLTNWLDFEAARFEDPYIGLAKFFLWADDAYGWGAGAKAGLVERYLFAQDVAPAAFLLRLVLRGLSLIQSADPGHPSQYLLSVVEEALARLGSMRKRGAFGPA